MCRFCQHNDEDAGPVAAGRGESPGTSDGVRGILPLAPASLSSLQLALELVQKTPIRSIGDYLLRTAFDHAQLVQPQRIEAYCVFGVVFPPGAVWVLGQCLQRILVAFGESALTDQPARHFWLARSQTA